MCCLEMDGYQYCERRRCATVPDHIADQSKYLLQPLKDPLVAVAAADNGVFIPQTLLGSIESLATTRTRGFLRLSLRHG